MEGKYKNIKIQGMAAAVPSREIENKQYENLLGARQLKRQTRITGVSKRKVSGKYQRSSDLCYGATVPLMEKLNWRADEIKVLILVTQTPNYRFPSTAFFVASQLGISKDCVMFDINLGCSSFPVGVQVVSSLLQNCEAGSKGLLLLSDVVKDFSYPEMRVEKEVVKHNMLFGSAGAAVALEKTNEETPLLYMTRSDGDGYDSIIQHQGRPASMDGGAVFDFAINDVSKDLLKFRKHFCLQEEDIDYYVFHQAQKMILDTIMNTCEFPREKELRSLEDYGNTSGVSIPVSICANQEVFVGKKNVRLLSCGFGVGLSWSLVYSEINAENILPIIVTDECCDKDKKPCGMLREKTVLIFGADSDMGECVTRYMSSQSAEVVMIGKDIQKLTQMKEELWECSHVYEGSQTSAAEIIKELEEKDFDFPIAGIILVSEEDNDTRMTEVFQYYNQEDTEIQLIVVEEKKNRKHIQELIETLDAQSLSEKLCVNAVTYDSDKMELKQIVGDGVDWLQEFFDKGCPDYMKKPYHVGLCIRFLLDDAGQFTSGTVMRCEK